jgi:hypothetical protein
MVLESAPGSYDVALSFSGEDRPYVAQVAAELRVEGVTVFYDADEQAALWGEDLYVYLDKIYRRAAHYCVMFISKSYAERLWTTHERMSLQARDFINAHDGSVLPARFDGTEIPGLMPRIAYVDLRNMSPKELASLIAEKVLGKRRKTLREALKTSLELVRAYLAPQPLASSDSVAQEIRSAFSSCGYLPTPELVEPYIRSDLPAERVVGYFAYQMAPYMWSHNLWHEALERELKYAITARETRPLWQLLVCLALFGVITNPEEMQFVHLPLPEALNRLRAARKVDPGGECAAKIQSLISVFPWMSGPGGYTWTSDEYPWHFQWSSGKSTYGLTRALEYVRSNPAEARNHIAKGDFQNWYSIHVPSSADIPDLMAAIVRELSHLTVS